jgi:hypothetical protein
VLAEVLYRELGDLTATEMIRNELGQAASLATVAPVWADLTRAATTRRYEAAIRALLPPGEWQRYQQDSERGTVTRLLRAAELAGYDTGAVIWQAVSVRDFAGARSIAAVLHGRIQRIVGTPEPVPAASYLARTPVIDDPQDRAFAAELAAAMDARVGLLGQRAAQDRPQWALTALGQIPAGPAERADWTRRAGVAAAYREERGWASHADPIGPAPDRASPELRASWHAAYTALRLPDPDRDTRAATRGELLAKRAALDSARSQANLGTAYEIRRQQQAPAARETHPWRAAQRQSQLAGRHAEPDLEPEAGG